MIQRITLPEYKPDQSNNSGVLLTANNVYPALDGYRSIGAVAAISDSLTAAFAGGYSAISSGGTAYLLAGTASTLERLSSGTWSSLLTGLSITGRWRFAQFDDYVVAVNGSTTREVDLSAGTASALADAPTGTCIAVIGDHVVIGQAGGEINKVQWSAFNDHTGWEAGTDQSGFQPMNSGGAVEGISGGEYGVIFQRERIVRMTRTGNPLTPFVFDEISANFGCASGATIATAGRTSFFLSDRGFMAIDDGQSLRAIGSEKVDRTFAAEVPRDSFDNIFTAVDPANKLVFWCVPGTPGKLWIYNFELDRWSTATLTTTGVMPGFTTSISLDDFPGLGYTNLDAVTISLDSDRWSGGAPRLYVVDGDGAVGALSGENLAAQIDMGFSELVPGRRARLRKIRPVTDAIRGLSVELNAKARLGDASALNTFSTLELSGVVPVRTAGRYISTSVRIAAGETWGYIQGLEYEAYAGGRR